jgi:hypothetical protein
MAKKDIIGTYGKSFNDTPKGKELSDIIVKIESEIKMEEKLHKEEYKKALALVDPSWSIERKNRAYAEIAKKRCDADSQSYKARVTELVNAKENYANAIKAYAEKIEGNDAWNDLIHRKDAIKMLKVIDSESGATELTMELGIHGCQSDSGKQNRYCMPIQCMETLGWIVRDGSGKIGDAKVSRITDEGKRQIEFYERFGMFDSSKVA